MTVYDNTAPEVICPDDVTLECTGPEGVLRTDPRLVKRMGNWEVARRWLRVYPGKRVHDGS